MHYTIFSTENSHRLFVHSMNKYHRVSHLAFTEEGHTHLFNKKGLIAVAHLPCNGDAQVMADQYGGNRTMRLEDKSTNEKPYTAFYFEAWDGNFYQVAHVSTSRDEANAFMLKRDDAALIDSTTITGLTEQYHFIASLVKSKKVA